MRNWVPMLSWIFDKPTGVVTPVAIKIVAVVQGLLLVMTAGSPSTEPGSSSALWTVAAWTITSCVMIALWNMKRWAVLVLAAYALVYVGFAAPYLAVAWRGIVLGVATRSVGLVAGAIYWKRMTWR